MTDAEIDAVVKKIRELNPDATIVTTDWDQLNGAKILEAMESKQTLNAELDKLREEAYEELEAHEHEHEHHHHHDDDHDEHEHEHHHHHHHDHDDDHDHDEHENHHHHHHHHHGHDADEVFDEVGVQTSNKYTRAELDEIVDCLDECGEVLRAKGIVENSEGGWLEFDYVPGEGEVRESAAEATGMIVVIGTRLNKEKINKLFRLA
jgi:G3E family GTPase